MSQICDDIMLNAIFLILVSLSKGAPDIQAGLVSSWVSGKMTESGSGPILPDFICLKSGSNLVLPDLEKSGVGEPVCGQTDQFPPYHGYEFKLQPH